MPKKVNLIRADATIALAYARLSGVEGDEISPEIQLKTSLRVAASLGLTADPRPYTEGGDVYADASKGMHSARKRDNIPEWYALIERARQDARVGAVVAYDMQRAFRNVRAMLEEAELLNSFGVKLVRVRGGEVDLQTADGRRRAIDDANAAEYHSHKTSELLKDHYEMLREQGIRYDHTPPLGLNRVGKVPNVKFEPNEDFKTIVLLCELYAQGDMGAPRLAVELEKRGVTWISRKDLARTKRISQRTVSKTIDKIERYKEWLPADLYARVLEVRAVRASRAQNRRVKHPSLALRGLVFCAICESRYIATTVHHLGRKKRGSYYYKNYTHPQPVRCGTKPATIRAEHIEEKIWARLSWMEDLTAEDRDAIARAMVTQPAPFVRDTTTERAALMEQLQRLNRNWLSVGMSNAEYTVLRKEIEKQLDALPVQVVPEVPTLDYPTARRRVDRLFDQVRERDNLAPEELNALMRALIKKIAIRDGEIESVEWLFSEEGVSD